MGVTWLKDLREDKKFSQAYVAKRLGISQSQYGRYETNPDDIPLGKLKALSVLLGFDPNKLDSLQEQFDGLNLGDPYCRNREYSKILKKFALLTIGSSLESNSVESTKVDTPDIEDLRYLLKKFDRKPTIAIAGQFDTGKTRLANYLLGGDYLPVKRQPATKYINIIRHISDAPIWLEDDIYSDRKQVFILSQEIWNIDGELVFELEFLDDKLRFEQAILKSTTLYALREYGIYFHQRAKQAIFGNSEIDNAHTAIIYIDSPFLLSCNLVDVPGINDRDNSIDDETKLKPIADLMDGLIYMSQLNGFMDTVDQLSTKYLLSSSIKDIRRDINSSFGNIFFVCSQASPSIVNNEELDQTMEIGAIRLFNSIENSVIKNLQSQEESDNISKYSFEELKQQFCSFWAESELRNENLINGLSHLLQTTFPQAYLSRFEEEISNIKEQADVQCSILIEQFNSVISNLEDTRIKLKQIKETEPERKRNIVRKTSELKLKIEEVKILSIKDFNYQAKSKMHQSSIQNTIEKKFENNKNAATRDAPLIILDQIEGIANDICRKKYDDIVKHRIQELLKTTYLEAYPSFENKKPGTTRIPFNFKRLGIDVLLGSSAVLVSTIFAPAMLPVAVSIAIVGWISNRQSWQTRLAKQIQNKFDENGYVEIISEGINEFWEHIETEFDEALESLEQQIRKSVEELELITQESNHEYVLKNLERLGYLREFFNRIPASYTEAKSSE